LTRQEREIERALVQGEWADVERLNLAQGAQAVAHRKRGARGG